MATKAANKVEYNEYTVGDKKVKLPVINEASFLASMRRETRKYSNDEASEHIFWMVCEAHLTPEELAVLDSLTMDELNELMEQFTEDEDLGKK